MQNLGFFHGIQQLYSKEFMEFIAKSHVVIVGIGGVGSWAAESIVRSGIGEISLVDMDEVCASNINRQVHATNSTISKAKVDVMAYRLLDINPECKVHKIFDFYTAQTSDDILGNAPTIVIDAIDSLQAKCHLLASCQSRNIPVVCCGSAGGRVNPEKICIKDLNKTINDRLLYRVRKKLRKDFDFSRSRKPYGIATVYSEEITEIDQEATTGQGKLNCNAALGSASFITASIGLFAAAEVMRQLHVIFQKH